MGCLSIAGLPPSSMSPVPFIHLSEERQCGVRFLVYSRYCQKVSTNPKHLHYTSDNLSFSPYHFLSTCPTLQLSVPRTWTTRNNQIFRKQRADSGNGEILINPNNQCKYSSLEFSILAWFKTNFRMLLMLAWNHFVYQAVHYMLVLKGWNYITKNLLALQGALFSVNCCCVTRQRKLQIFPKNLELGKRGGERVNFVYIQGIRRFGRHFSRVRAKITLSPMSNEMYFELH